MTGAPVSGGAVAAAVAALLTGPIPATETPPSGSVSVAAVTISGSGCTDRTTRLVPSPDGTSFSLGFDDVEARIGVGTHPTDFRRNCALSLLIQAPPEFSHSVRSVEYAGTADLAGGSLGRLRSSQYYAGAALPWVFTHSLPGPYTGNWQAADVIDESRRLWSPCGATRLMNLTVEVRLTPGPSDVTSTTSSMSLTSSYSGVGATYHLDWKSCPSR